MVLVTPLMIYARSVVSCGLLDLTCTVFLCYLARYLKTQYLETHYLQTMGTRERSDSVSRIFRNSPL